MTREQYIERTARAMYGERWQCAEAQRTDIRMADKAATVYPFDREEHL